MPSWFSLNLFKTTIWKHNFYSWNTTQNKICFPWLDHGWDHLMAVYQVILLCVLYKSMCKCWRMMDSLCHSLWCISLETLIGMGGKPNRKWVHLGGLILWSITSVKCLTDGSRSHYSTHYGFELLRHIVLLILIGTNPKKNQVSHISTYICYVLCVTRPSPTHHNDMSSMIWMLSQYLLSFMYTKACINPS